MKTIFYLITTLSISAFYSCYAWWHNNNELKIITPNKIQLNEMVGINKKTPTIPLTPTSN